ncbi:MAG: hypothetical protein R3253_00570 [Longimicrobiales bacterium]|nr:hypothetical protein [Longimicrobiales bacterium]
MSEPRKRTIGDILKGLGRITEDDVETALAYQREHGGFFGAALVACGIVSEEEIEFGLASQFDLPYLFPEADAVDLEAAALVSAEWALEHLTLPILKTDDTLRVVVDSPFKDEALEELTRKTSLEVELGLASPSTIRELIRQVYARAAAQEEEPKEPLSLENTLDAVADADSARWGISIRGGRAHAWWDDHGTIRRRTLAGDWGESLEGIMEPPPSQAVTGTRTQWDATIGRDRAGLSVTVHCIADESGREYLFLARDVEATLEDRFPPPPEGIVSEVRILARSGTARFAVTCEPSTLGHEILPHLPELLLDPSWRSIYVNADDQPEEGRAFSVRLSSDPSAWAREIEELKIFHFDVVTVDLPGEDRSWADAALDVAAVAFFLWPEEELEEAREAGVRWRLSVRASDDGEQEWGLDPLRTS